MNDNHYGVYFVPRRSTRRRKRYGAGILIFVLLLLTAGICVLAVMLPKITDVTAKPITGFAGCSFYVLSTGESDELTEAMLRAKDTSDRGGAGYIFNDGKYRVIAAVYAREADAKLLSGVNENSYYFELKLPAASGEGDAKALEYFAGEWFETVSNAAGDLERGKITEAAAEFAVSTAVNKLSVIADSCDSPALNRAMCADFVGTTVLNKIRYVQASAVVNVYSVLNAMR